MNPWLLCSERFSPEGNHKGFFIDESQRIWVGKPLHTEEYGFWEILGYHFYQLFGIQIPPEVGLVKINEKLHVFSQKIDGFHELKSDFIQTYLEQKNLQNHKRYMVPHPENSEKQIPLVGLGEFLSVEYFLRDLESFGPGVSNIGWVLAKDSEGQSFAQLVKNAIHQVDDQNELPYNPNEKLVHVSQTDTLNFHELTKEDQQGFLDGVKKILDHPFSEIRVLIELACQHENLQGALDSICARLESRREKFSGFSELIETPIQSEPQSLTASETQIALALMEPFFPDPIQQRYSLAQDIFMFQLPDVLENFIGRSLELELLEEYLRENQKSVISGISGVGKTQLAIEYAHMQLVRSYYQSVIWFFAETAIEIQIRELAEVLCQIKDPVPVSKLIKKIFQKLSQQGVSLIVWDHVESKKSLEEFLSINAPENIHVLITTRKNLWNNLRTFPLDVFSVEEGRQYVFSRLGNELKLSHVDQLLVSLQNFPLALSRAVAFISKSQCSLEDYPRLFSCHQLKVCDDEEEDSFVNINKSSVMLSLIPLQRSTDQTTWKILQSCIGLASDRIPVRIIADLLSVETPEILNAYLIVLKDLNLIQAESNFGFSVHRGTLLVLDELWNSIPQRSDHLAKLAKCLENRLKHHSNDKTPRELIAYHAEFCIRVMQRSKSASIIELPLAELLFQLAHFYLSSMKFGNQNFALLTRALSIFESKLGDDHIRLAPVLLDLAIANESMKNYEQERIFLERAIKIQENHFGVDHPGVAMSLVSLAAVHGELGNLLEKKSLLQRALKIQESSLGFDHPDVASTLVTLAEVLGELDENQEALITLQLALKIMETHFGTYHPEVAVILSSLGIVQGKLGNYFEGKLVLERSLQIKESLFGVNDLQIVLTLSNLASVCSELGNFQEEKAFLERALTIQESHLGINHLDVASTLVSLGNVLNTLGNFSESKSVLERALQIQESILGSEQPEIALTLTSLAMVQSSLENHQETKSLLETALKVQESVFGSDHPDVATTLVNLGIVIGELGNPIEKQALLERALSIFQSVYGSDHPQVINVLSLLQ